MAQRLRSGRREETTVATEEVLMKVLHLRASGEALVTVLVVDLLVTSQPPADRMAAGTGLKHLSVIAREATSAAAKAEAEVATAEVATVEAATEEAEAEAAICRTGRGRTLRPSAGSTI